MKYTLITVTCLVLSFFIGACGGDQDAAAPSTEGGTAVADEARQQPASAEGDSQTFQATGVVRSITPNRNYINVKHEAIPGFMDAMTMPFAVKDSQILDGVEASDTIDFTIEVTGNAVYVSEVKRVE